MNKILFALILLLPAQAMAENQCILYAQLAEKIMEIRQENVPIHELLSLVDDPDSIKDLAIIAYKIPVKKLQSDKRNAAVEFGNLVFMVCEENKEPEGISL